MELEDIGKDRTPKKPQPLKAPLNDLNMNTQFPAWLTQQKKIWDLQIRSKKDVRKSQIKMRLNNPNNPTSGNLMNHFQVQTQALQSSVW